MRGQLSSRTTPESANEGMCRMYFVTYQSWPCRVYGLLGREHPDCTWGECYLPFPLIPVRRFLPAGR